MKVSPVRRRVLLILALLLGACGEDAGQLPPIEDGTNGDVILRPDNQVPDTGDVTSTEACQVAWSKTLQTGGSISHPALGKHDVFYVASGQKLYALGEAGNVEWTWPDDDAAWTWPDDVDPPPPWELYTPVLGREETLYMGSNGGHLVSVDKNGVGRFTLALEGNVTGAVAITDEKRVLIVTDQGAIYHLRDDIEFVVWQQTGDEKLIEFPRPALQPVIGPAEWFGVETLLVLSWDRVTALDADSGDLLWEAPLPAGHDSTSNLILDDDGNLLVATGLNAAGDYYEESYLVTIPPSGSVEAITAQLVYDSLTRVVSLSQGRFGTVLMGTENAGILSYDRPLQQLYWHFIPNQQNFETVAQPLQAADGLVYFGAGRHWIHVVKEVGDEHYNLQLDVPDNDLGAILWPSSPVLTQDGLALFHNGNQVHAIRCSEAGPSVLTWPRFGSNNQNSGNIHDGHVE